MHYAFVILHYLTYKDTVECVESILENITNAEYSIIIVDNGSNNESGDQLQKKYAENKKLHIITSKINLGFAKGNNLGYSYAKNHLDVDFIIMINNDTIINQKEFLANIETIYNDNKFDVLGPDIVSMIDQRHQNPYRTDNFSYTEKNINKLILKRYRNIVLSYFHIYDLYVFIYRNIIKKYLHQFLQSNSYSQRYDKVQYDVKLHGSCWIFSPDYIKKFKGLYSKTFMYLEEDILFYIAKQEGLRLIYSPDVKIFHKEDSSTNALLNSNRKKRIFICKNEISSAKEFVKIINNKSIYKENVLDIM